MSFNQNKRSRAFSSGLLAFLFSWDVCAQQNSSTTSPPVFDGILTPWQTQGIDPDQLRSARPALENSWKKLNSRLFSPPRDLSTLAPSPLPINQARRARQYSLGNFGTNSPLTPLKGDSSPVTIEPRWCRIYDYQVVFTTVSMAKTNQLLASSHRAIPVSQWSQMVRSGTLEQFLTQSLSALLNELGTQNSPSELPPSNLSVALTLKQENSSPQDGLSHCLVLLMEEALLPQLSIPRSLGADHLALVRGILPFSNGPRRPTRYLLTHVSPLKPGPKALPQTLQTSFEMIEGVFGKQTPERLESSFTLEPPGTGPTGMLRWNLSPTKAPLVAVQPLLAQESAAVLRRDRPQVLKIRGAWAYLDRGRAWGLNMGDRLQTTDGTIKGHVVRYFGPEEKLVAKAGFPVYEGAIMYVRKGQKKLQQGMVMDFDPTTFPTPWPPAK